MAKNVLLVIRDGWGINPDTEYNAVANAQTPNMDSYLAQYPNTVIDTSGTAVGLPEGYQGSSEVGHLNIGAGRIVKQEVTRIFEAMQDGSFFENPNFVRAVKGCTDGCNALHVMGLVQNEGVHAHQDHLFEVLRYASENGLKQVYIHFFADGRDTAPRSAPGFLKTVQAKCKEYGVGQIATLQGRYYAMDRGKNYNLTDKAYAAITRAEGQAMPTAEEAIAYAYDNLRQPDGSDMSDEYIPPMIIGDYKGMMDGDSVLHFNYRQDRAIQLTQAFVDSEETYPGSRGKMMQIGYCGLTKYYDEFEFNVMDALSTGSGMENLLGEVISKQGLRQLRISETQKIRHVTSFMNGKRMAPYEGEDRIEIKSDLDPSSFADHPEMSAYEIADSVLTALDKGVYNFIAVNFANGDMVGHTGNFEAATKAIEIVDECLGKVVDKALQTGSAVIITSDHGNSEQMRDPDTGEPKTSHTVLPVELVYIDKDAAVANDIKLRERGILADIAPMILELMAIAVPPQMTSKGLIIK